MANEKNESKNIENAKNRIIEIIKALNDENTKKLLKAVEEALIDEKKVTNSTNQCIPGKKQFWFIFSAIIILGMILSVFKPFINAGDRLEFEMLFGFLVFVVALASYVASVARQIIERLRTDKLKEKITPRKSLYYLVIAEMHLVIVGILAIIRLIYSPSPLKLSPYICFTFNSFLISYFAVILIYMVYLHGRAWYYTTPWNIETSEID